MNPQQHRIQLSPDSIQLPGVRDVNALVDRIVKLRAVLPVMAAETISARREANRLRSENQELEQRLAALQGSAGASPDQILTERRTGISPMETA